ncbi:hypothetical protein L3i20_v241500 [Paenibacillus sp. L3-i20]|nr:hypothetical protein L3i20_v241500 [Paenibacillus sp. L3-i20]
MSVQTRKVGSSTRSKLLMGVSLLGAVLLLVAALMGNKSSQTAEWIPLNEAVQASLDHSAKLSEEQLGSAEEQSGSTNETASKQHEAASQEHVAIANDGEKAIKGNAEDTKGHKQTDANTMNNPGVKEAVSKDGTGKIDINRATKEQLDQLKGIGPSKAEAIVNDREKNGLFKNVDDLLRVKGIGKKLLEGLKESVVAHP